MERINSCVLFSLSGLFCLILSSLPSAAAPASVNGLHKLKAEQDFAGLALVRRKEHILCIYDQSGKKILETPVGIGRGGIAEKKSMDDCITPAGDFVVDIVLYQNDIFDDVDVRVKERYKGDSRSRLLNSRGGLNKLFQKMNSLDFNSDGKADTAYGVAYLGLNSEKGLSGPKLSKFKNTDYWFSIAIHGTPDEVANISKSSSGGCIQVPAQALGKIVESRMLKVGSRVRIE